MVELLSEAHRRQQLTIRNATVRDVSALWSLVSLDNIDEVWPGVETALLSMIARRRLQSTQVAGVFYNALRGSKGLGATSLAEVREGWERRARVSLFVTGNAGAKTARLYNHPRPLDVAFVRVSGAATRHALDGGRQLLQDTTVQDPDAIGWARVTSSNPCDFCSMLAGRGAVYTEATGAFRSHDHCSCSVEPRWRL